MTKQSREKRLPIGIENFEKIRSAGFYYVDKTGLIADFLNGWGEVNLFTRPRRFGKSLNMSMFKYFFEIGCDRTLFDGLKIAEETGLCEEYMGRFPVLSISMKGVNAANFEKARARICALIGKEAMRFSFLLHSEKLNDVEKKLYEQLIHVDTTGQESFLMPDSVLEDSLQTLSALLEKHYGEKTVILIDEYDVPLAKAHEQGYYEEMALLIRNMFEKALKTNDSLYFAILTGCLRVSKESIFTGLNNPNIYSITDPECDSYFGFTDDEVKRMLEYYGLSDKFDVIKEWYDGYCFGDADVYCPWDVVSYVAKLRTKRTRLPENFWANTSGNEVVRHFLEKVDKGLAKGEMEALIAGETVEKSVYTELTYKDLYSSIDHIWSVLFTTGYLTNRGQTGDGRYQLAIPNREIRRLFTDQIMAMFREAILKDGETLRLFCGALETGDRENVELLFTEYLMRTISIRDTFVRKPTKENFYHGILLGLLGYKSGWEVKSNKEAGDGYSDIMIKTEGGDTGMIIEVKYAEDGAFSRVCDGALRQIETCDYRSELRKDGYHIILKYGIACYKKKCRVVFEREKW